MEIESKYSVIFKSDDLTKEKYSVCYDRSKQLLDFRNMISNEIHRDLYTFLNMSDFDFAKFMTKRHKGEISSNVYKQTYNLVYTCYKNKFVKVRDKIVFQIKKYKGISYYKKDTLNNKKGDFKSFETEIKKSLLTTCLTHLARYGNSETKTINFIKNELLSEKISDNKFFYYVDILDKINKFGYERLFRIAEAKRINIINKYNKKQVEFTKLTFSGRCRKKQIIGYNKNYNSKINAFISLSWDDDRKSLDIPVKYSKDYHGKMQDFLKKNPDYEYTMTINEKEKQVNVILCKSGVRYIPDSKTNFIGIDVNQKHNLFSLSNNKTVDFDRKLLSDYVEVCLQNDERKQKNEKYKIGKRNQFKIDKLKEKMLKYNQQLISSMCKELKSQGFDHIVMENLTNGFGKSFVKKDDINFNRIVSFLKLSSLKNEVEHIGRNYDIAISFVHAEYTSKMCAKCGCIDDDNRKCQEEFLCVSCGHADNADHNASVNIENRVTLTVLRDKLLKQTDNGAYVPLNKKRDDIKKALLSFRYE